MDIQPHIHNSNLCIFPFYRVYIHQETPSRLKLFVNKVDETDEGEYHCHAKVGDKTLEASTRLELFRKLI